MMNELISLYLMSMLCMHCAMMRLNECVVYESMHDGLVIELSLTKSGLVPSLYAWHIMKVQVRCSYEMMSDLSLLMI